jgi:hypothetical protein
MAFSENTEKKVTVIKKMSKTASPYVIAYLAGFFDGEGSIMANHQASKNHRDRLYITVKIGNTDIRPLQLFTKYFGCKIQKAVNGRKKPFYFFNIGEAKSRVILEKFFPYLIVKHKQAELALEFYREKLNIGNPNNFKNSQKLKDIRDQIIKLNNRSHLLNS